MYYKKHDEIPRLPEDITRECINFANYCLDNNLPMSGWYGKKYETVDETSVQFIDPIKEFESKGGKETGGVGFFPIPKELLNKIINYYSEINNPLIDFDLYFIQVVTGGEYVGPHKDDPIARKTGMLYLLKSGGDNVKTIWYKLKPEYQHKEIENYKYIPYSKLDIMEEHKLEENTWHFMNFDEVHSVENQETLRLAIWGTKASDMGY